MLCAYCDEPCVPTREHVIPDWYCQTTDHNTETFNARRPTTHTRGDISIKDVCEHCNNIKLGALDAYGKSIYNAYLQYPVYFRETISISFDRELLLRWLMKMSYNSARIHEADTLILKKYRQYMLGNEPIPGQAAVFVYLVSPTDFGTTPPSPGWRLIGNKDITPPEWFRLTQIRSNPSNQTDIVQRQVYINSYCFTIFVGDPDNDDHKHELITVREDFLKGYGDAQEITSNVGVTISVNERHASSALADHISNYPARYGDDEPLSENPEYSSALSKMIDGEPIVLIVQASREEIDACNVSAVVSRLREMVSTRESAVATAQRIAVTTDAYDHDPREVWDIPEARRFFARVFVECPFIFLLGCPKASTIKLLAACTCSTTSDGNVDPNELKRFLDTGFVALNSVTQRFALSVELNRRITESIFEQLGMQN